MALLTLDLFSGIGGFALAGQMVGGFEVTQFVEINPYCQSILAKNFPGVPIHGDIKTYSTSARRIDVVTGGSPARIFRSPTPTGEDWKVTVPGCSMRSCELFASADPVTSYWKTLMRYLLPDGVEIWEQYSGSFPSAGMMQSGRLYRQRAWVRRTYARECLLLPTPAASDCKSATSQEVCQKIIHRGKSPRLGEAISARMNGKLNPAFVEWLMGFPIGWTELKR